MSSIQHLQGFYSRPDDEVLADPQFVRTHALLLAALEDGSVRAAVCIDGVWRAEAWVKRAILFGFRNAETVEMPNGTSVAFDRSTYPPRTFLVEDRVRLVPGGSAVRRGAHVAPGVVIMPPSYVNVGAYVGDGCMVDSQALVGSCAQIGRNVHLSTGVKIGGVLEPIGAAPVVVEDECFMGAQSGAFEGVVVRRGSVIAPGVLLTAASRIYDLVRDEIVQGEVPERSVVVPGSRALSGPFATEHGLSAYAPLIVKIRNHSTDAATELEQALRC